MNRPARALWLLLALTGALAASARARPASPMSMAPGTLELRVERMAEGVRLLPEIDESIAADGLWRWRRDGGAWQQERAAASAREFSLVGGWIEVELQLEAESGTRRARRVIWAREPSPRVERRPAPDAVVQKLGSIHGRALYRDRKFDLSGYSGSRRLPIRHQALELRRAADDSLLGTLFTDAAGYFSFPVDAAASSSVRIDLLSTLVSPGIGIALRDDLDQELRVTVANLTSVDPDTLNQLGELLLLDAPSPNILDTALDVLDFLADPAQLGALPDSGSVPVLRFDPGSGAAQTQYDGTEVRISSSGSGDDDGWSDCLILAALGQWAMEQFGAVDQYGVLSPVDVAVDMRRAQGDGAAMAFAAAVRQHRATTRFDADTKPVDDLVHAFVDLPTAPPLGVPVAPDWAFDLEQRRLDGFPVTAFGQLGAFNVACMLYDMLDDLAMLDGISGDDEALAGDATRWFQTAVLDLAPFAGLEWIRFELVHDAWRLRYGDEPELLAIAVTQGRSALFDDAGEPNDSAANAAELSLWIQPALPPGTSLRISEIFLGAVDAVELYNAGDQFLDLSGFTITSYRNGFSQTPARTTTLPQGTVVGPGRFLLVHEGAGPAATSSDLYDPAWSVPWRHDEDGACAVFDDGGVVADFLRWSGVGGMDPSQTPIPAGTGFTGVLVAPQLEPATLGRDPLGTDSDSATDFHIHMPTPRVPNVQGQSTRSIRPRDEVDWLHLPPGASQSIAQLHAFDPRDDAIPHLAVVDSLGNVLQESVALGRESWIEFVREFGTDRFLRLRQDPAAHASAAWSLFAWQPAVDASLLPVVDLDAELQFVDAANDDVLLTWTNVGSYQQLRIDLDGGSPLLTLSGGSESALVQVPAGHHELAVVPLLGAVEGAATTRRLYVGATACAVESGLESLPEIQAFATAGFAPTAGGYQSINQLRDVLIGPNYPDDDTATATLVEPIDLTSDARLEFVHHCHVRDDGDYAAVEISLDDGGSWIELQRFTESDHQGGLDPADWTDDVFQPGDWVAASIDLGAYAGQRVRVRFRRASNASGNSLGWGIDDVRFGSVHAGAWMDPFGSDQFGCGHRERPFQSAAVAWNAVAAGDTLHLAKGTHQAPSSLAIDGQMKSVLLPLRPGSYAVGVDSVVLDATGIDIGIYSEAGAADSVYVESLDVRDAALAMRSDAGHLLARSLRVFDFGVGFREMGGGADFVECLFARGDSVAVLGGECFHMQQSTVNGVDVGIASSTSLSSLIVDHSIFAQATGPFLAFDGLPAPTHSMVCNVFTGSPTPFVNSIEWVGLAGNVDVPVEFCDLLLDDYRLPTAAPALSLPNCGRAGAYGQGCEAPVANDPAVAPSFVSLGAAPNPFNPRTMIEWVLPAAAHCELRIFDVRGREIRALARGDFEAGVHRLLWNGRDLRGREVSSGIYYLELRAGGERLSRRLTLLR